MKPTESVLSRHFLLFAVIALVFAAILDPADSILHLKVPAFISAIAIWLYRRGHSRETVSLGTWSIVVVAGVMVPLAWTIIGIFLQGVHSGDAPFGLMKSFLFLVMLPLLISEDIDLISLVVRLGVIVAGLTLFMAAVNFLSPVVFLALYDFTVEKQNAIITSARDSFGIGVGQFYYKTSSLMIFPFTYHCGRLFRRGESARAPLSLCLLYGAAIVCSGTRANVLAALFVFGLLALHWILNSAGMAMALLAGALVTGVLMSTVIPTFANTKEESNVVKIGHVQSYVEEFETHPTTLVWGEGANNAFFTRGFNDWATLTEITYLELIRMFGLPVALSLMFGLFYIGCKLFAQRQWILGLAYLAYLGISASNPLLISSTGFLAICAVWKETVRRSLPRSAFHLKSVEGSDAEDKSVALLRRVRVES